MKVSVYISLLVAATAVLSAQTGRGESTKDEPLRANLKIKAGYFDREGNSIVLFDSTPLAGKKAMPEFLRKNPLVYCSGEHCNQLFREAMFGDFKSGLRVDFMDADGQRADLNTNPKKGIYVVTCRNGETASLKPMTMSQVASMATKLHKGEINVRSLPVDVRQIEYAYGDGSQEVYITSAKFNPEEKTYRAYFGTPSKVSEVKIIDIDHHGREGATKDIQLMNGLTLHVVGDVHMDRADLSGTRLKRIATPIDNKTVLPKIPGPIEGPGSTPCSREAGGAEVRRKAHSSRNAK